MDYVTTDANSSQGESQLYIFGDNKSVIKMIIKGKRPTMRHVSRTHRVALDWLFDRINLDPEIQIKYVDTENQLADMLTKGSFTRDEWDHLLRSLNIMNSSMYSCSHFLSNRKQSVMSKRAQQSISKEGSAVAKPRPMNLVLRNLLSAKENPPQDSSDSNSPGNQELDQSGVSSSGRKLTRNINQNPTSYSQQRQQDDTQSSTCTRKLERRDEPSKSASARQIERGRDIRICRSKMEIHNMHMSDYRYLEKVFKNLRKRLNLTEDSPMY